MALATGLIATSVAHAAAKTYEATPDTYRQLLVQLRPGDTLALAAGVYRAGLPLHGLAGNVDAPITITGPVNGDPAIFTARAEANTVSIVDSHHIVVKNLSLDGNDVPVDGVKCEGYAHYAHDIVLENLVIRGHGNNQQTVAISTKCPAWNWVIRGNTIIGAGTGIYLGDSDGSAPFVAGVIERNLVVDTIGYNLQIKHQHRRSDVAGLPQRGASVTVIRRNVFSKAAGGSTDAPRPNVLVGHFPPAGPGVDDRYLIHGNFFYANPSEALFQGEGNIALYSNLFVNPYGDAIHIQPHNDIPKNVAVMFNTVVAERTGISVVPGEHSVGYRQTVAGNAVFAEVPLAGGTQTANLASSFAQAGHYLARPFARLGELDLFPRIPLTSAGAELGAAAPLPDWDRDFNGQLRQPGSIGAYTGSGSNPGWRPALSRMPERRITRRGPARGKRTRG